MFDFSSSISSAENKLSSNVTYLVLQQFWHHTGRNTRHGSASKLKAYSYGGKDQFWIHSTKAGAMLTFSTWIKELAILLKQNSNETINYEKHSSHLNRLKLLKLNDENATDLSSIILSNKYTLRRICLHRMFRNGFHFFTIWVKF